MHDDDRYNLDKMELDRKDHTGAADVYDPFFKSNVTSPCSHLPSAETRH
jgi:hypothetical protein